MKHALELVKVLCLAALFVCLCALAVVLNQTRKTIDGIRIDTGLLEAKASKLLDTGQKASEEALAAESQQIKYLDKTSLEIYKTSAAARLVLVRLDRSLNDELVPKLSTALEGTNQLTRQAAESLHATTEKLEPTLENLARASGSAADAMADPSIRSSLDNLNAASFGVANTSLHLEAIAKDSHDVADKFRNEYLKPQKFAWLLLKELAGIGGSMAQMIK